MSMTREELYMLALGIKIVADRLGLMYSKDEDISQPDLVDEFSASIRQDMRGLLDEELVESVPGEVKL